MTERPARDAPPTRGGLSNDILLRATSLWDQPIQAATIHLARGRRRRRRIQPNDLFYRDNFTSLTGRSPASAIDPLHRSRDHDLRHPIQRLLRPRRRPLRSSVTFRKTTTPSPSLATCLSVEPARRWIASSHRPEIPTMSTVTVNGRLALSFTSRPWQPQGSSKLVLPFANADVSLFDPVTHWQHHRFQSFEIGS